MQDFSVVPLLTPDTNVLGKHRPSVGQANSSLGSFQSLDARLFIDAKNHRVLRKAAVFTISLALFAGVLYGTSAYLRGVGILAQISNPFAEQTGHANTDINLRPDPSVNNDPIGVVTRNSRVRIVKIQNNWYQVDILEQGRPRDQQLPTTRGWLNGKYIDLD